MRLARISRGHDPRFLWQAGATARGVGVAVRALLRARRAGAPRDAVARLDRRRCPGCPTPSPPGGTGRSGSPRSRWRLALAVTGWAIDVTAAPERPAADRHRRPPPSLQVSRAGLRLPGRPPGPVRRRPARSSAASGWRCSARTAPARPRWCCTSTASCTAGHGVGRRRRAAGRAAEPARDPPPGRHRLPGPRRPAVHADRRRGRRVRAGQLRRHRRRAARPGWTPRWPPSGWPSTATAPRCTCPAGSAAGWRWPPCWPASRRSWCSTSRRRTSTRWPAASWPRCCSAWTRTMLMVTHDLPYALQLCPRSVVLDDGRGRRRRADPRAARRPRAAAPAPARAALRLHPAPGRLTVRRGGSPAAASGGSPPESGPARRRRALRDARGAGWAARCSGSGCGRLRRRPAGGRARGRGRRRAGAAAVAAGRGRDGRRPMVGTGLAGLRLGVGDHLGDLRVAGGVEPVLDRARRPPPGADARRRPPADGSKRNTPSSPGAPSIRVKPSSALPKSRRHHPDLVGVALRHLRQRLQVLVGQQLRGRLARLDRGEHLLDRLGLALRLQVAGGPLALRAQDPGLPLGLGGEDRRLLGALGGEDLASASGPPRCGSPTPAGPRR